MTSFFNWRVLSYALEPPEEELQLQRSVAVAREQAVFAMTWRRRGGGVCVHRVPFAAFVAARQSAPRADVAEFTSAKDAPHVPPPGRLLMLQAADTGDGGCVLTVCNGQKMYLYRISSREWEPPIVLSAGGSGLSIRQFIGLGGPHMFIQYTTERGPQFALVDVGARRVQNPVEILGLPRSHGLTFFTSEHNRTLNAIVDRWPRCSREWWSFDLDEVLAQAAPAVECRQIHCDPIQLHYSEFVPVGNRWVFGVDGGRWNYHEDENLLPSGGAPAAPNSSIIDKTSGQVHRISPLLETRSTRGELPAVTCSPSFYVPYKATELATLELPALLSQTTGQLSLRIWCGTVSSLLAVDRIWAALARKFADPAVVVRIVSFML